VKTGPFGRLARLVLAAVVIVSLVSIADQGGPGSFRGPGNLLELSLLLLDAIMLVLFVNLVGVVATVVGGRDAASPSRVVAFVVVVAAIGVAAMTSQATHGTVWNSPLSALVWWFDAFMLAETSVALLLAIALGIPGCKIGVWPFLIARLRGERPPLTSVGCVVGLHLIDQWEASRRPAGG
jgi:hypothetical protein